MRDVALIAIPSKLGGTSTVRACVAGNQHWSGWVSPSHESPSLAGKGRIWKNDGNTMTIEAGNGTA